MRKVYFLFFLFVLCCRVSFSQGGTWTWISGASTSGSLGVFGTQGVPSVNNHPPGLYEAAEWKDKQGNFWIYGGWDPAYSDLWKFNLITLEWTWVKGNGLTYQLPIYGTQGVANPANTPGERPHAAITWVDTSGNFWLMGGADSLANPLNDLWKYDIGTNQWTWINGSTIPNANGVHGTQGVPSPLNTPGARNETCSSWTDSLDNLWLFGGYGIDDNSNTGTLNDLCKYNISTNEWTWMKGSAYADDTANFGTKGVPNISNDPGGRLTYTKWKDLQGNFWLFGGLNLNLNSFFYNFLNDLWKYDSNTNIWIWMSGTNVIGDSGTYQSICVFDTINLPSSRFEQRSTVTDNCGKFWLFGGEGTGGQINDLWVFNPQNLKWNWVNGTNVPYQVGSYGTLGVTSTSNMPPSRYGAVAWWGNDNRFYVFGGNQNNTGPNYSDVWVFTPDTNCIPNCDATVLAAHFISSDTVFCNEGGKCINFTDHSAGNPTSWQWIFTGALPDTSSLQNPVGICYTVPGTYPVTLIVSNGNGTDTTIVSSMIIFASPPTAPTLSISNDTIFSSHAATYQWYFNGSPIAGATDSFYVFTTVGTYAVQISDGNGCSVLSSGMVITAVSSIQSSSGGLTLYPNPARNEFIVDGLSFIHNATLEVYNAFGKKVYSRQLQTPNSKLQTINCKQFPSGIYFVRATDGQRQYVGKIVIEK